MKLDAFELGLSGCYAAPLGAFSDPRGTFQKLFHNEAFDQFLPGFVPREVYISASAQGVLRGMHFQLPPFDHAKVVICLGGSVLDVMVDLRAGDDFGQTASIELTPDEHACVMLPPGIGHGFLSHVDDTKLLYLVETTHNPDADRGIHWESIGFDWPVTEPIVSDRDKTHLDIANFSPPARWRHE